MNAKIWLGNFIECDCQGDRNVNMKIENCRRIFYMTVKDNDNGHTVKLCVISHQII